MKYYLMLLQEVQGTAFYEGYMYLSSNLEDAVYKLNITTGVVEYVLSDKSYPIEYYYEMEGLAFWDLRDQHLGVMHM